MSDVSVWGDVALAVLGGAIRVGTPFLFVSLGECLTEKSGRINLGLEGVLAENGVDLDLKALLVFSAVMGALWVGFVLDYGWFREQFCNYLCPYARFQGALTDDESLVVAYEVSLGHTEGRVVVFLELAELVDSVLGVVDAVDEVIHCFVLLIKYKIS